jgi:hypothetical protein
MGGEGGYVLGEENERTVLNFVHLNKICWRRNRGDMSNMDKYKIFC